MIGHFFFFFLALLGPIGVKQKCDSLNKPEFIFRSVLMQRERQVYMSILIFLQLPVSKPPNILFCFHLRFKQAPLGRFPQSISSLESLIRVSLLSQPTGGVPHKYLAPSRSTQTWSYRGPAITLIIQEPCHPHSDTQKSGSRWRHQCLCVLSHPEAAPEHHKCVAVKSFWDSVRSDGLNAVSVLFSPHLQRRPNQRLGLLGKRWVCFWKWRSWRACSDSSLLQSGGWLIKEGGATRLHPARQPAPASLCF